MTLFDLMIQLEEYVDAFTYTDDGYYLDMAYGYACLILERET